MSVCRSFLVSVIVLSVCPPQPQPRFTAGATRTASSCCLTSRARSGALTATYEVHGAATVRATTPLASTAKSAPFEASITEHARRQGVAADLVRAVIQVESAFNPTAVSSKGAMGLMQLMPATATELGVRNPFDPDQNIRGGVAYLRRLLDRYDGKVELALAAYNAGIGNVEKYGDVPPFKETKNYVKKITGACPAGAGQRDLQVVRARQRQALGPLLEQASRIRLLRNRRPPLEYAVSSPVSRQRRRDLQRSSTVLGVLDLRVRHPSDIEVLDVAKSNKSALKANRQNIKRREHNRALRARLRTGLKGIRKSLDDKDVEGAKTALKSSSRSWTRWPPRASSTRTPRRATSRGSPPKISK